MKRDEDRARYRSAQSSAVKGLVTFRGRGLFLCSLAYSDSPAASRAYRFTSLIFLLSVFGVPPSGV